MADDNAVEPGSVEALAAKLRGIDAGNTEDVVGAVDEVVEAPVAEVPAPPALTPLEETQGEELELGSAEEAADAAEAELGADATDAEIAQARADAADGFYAGRYKTRDEVEKALKEQIQLIGRQGQELGTLKKQLEEQAATAEVAEDVQPQQLDRSAWNDWAEEQVDQGLGSQAAVQALADGGYEGYEIVMGKWLTADDEQERAAAILFNNAMMIRMQQEQAREQQAAAVPEVADMSTENAAARTIVASKRPDFDEMKPYMNQVVERMSEEERSWLSTLAESGVEGKVRALDLVYLEAKASSGDTRAQAAVVASRQTTASSDRAKLAASDAPSVMSKTRTPLPEAEAVAIAYGDERRRIWGTPLKGSQE